MKLKLKDALSALTAIKVDKNKFDKIETIAGGLAGHGVASKVKQTPEMVTMLSGKKQKRYSTAAGKASQAAYSKFKGRVK